MGAGCRWLEVGVHGVRVLLGMRARGEGDEGEDGFDDASWFGELGWCSR